MKSYNKAIKISDFAQLIFDTPNNIGNWFGYYNYDVLSNDQKKMLCQKVSDEAKEIRSNMRIECGYYDIPLGKWHHIGYTDSYNWPQGSMLQWIPGEESKRVVYNSSKDGHLISIIHDLENSENDKIVHFPIYGITPDGKKSITLNMERSFWCRAYHYYSVMNEKYNVRVPDDDGVYEIDLSNNRKKRIISIQDIINIEKEGCFDKAKHWLEHIMISPNGKRFCFLHRFSFEDDYKYITRLFIADINGENIQLIDKWKSYEWSHFGWQGDDAFVIYTYERDLNSMKITSKGEECNHQIVSNAHTVSLKSLYRLFPKPMKKLIKYCVGENNRYYQYYCYNNGKFVLMDKFKNRAFSLDGHPSFTNDGRFMITDTYPDEFGNQHLYIYCLKTREIIELARIKAIQDSSRYLCDLHPKLCRNNDFIAIDTAYDDKHHMLLLKINWEKICKKMG